MRRDDEGIAFEIVFDASEGAVLTVRIAVPGGSLLSWVKFAQEGRTLLVTGVHLAVQGPGGLLTRTRMQAVARRVMEEMDYDAIIVEGAARTTGARPGHRPRRLRFP